MEVDDQQPLRDPLPRFQASPESVEERMRDLLSSHESRMKAEMRRILVDREAERSDSVQGDSGGSREGAAALGTRMNLLEVKLASEQSRLGQQLEEVRIALGMLTKELAEERKERQDIGQLAEMAVRTTRCLTEGTPKGGSSPAATAVLTGPDDADSQIWEQLAQRISAVAQEIRSEVGSELLVALRTELTAEMARKVATFQTRIGALESNLGGSVQKLLRDLSDRVGNLEAAQADATQVRERLLALEEQKGRASVSPQPQRQNYGGNRNMWPEVEDFTFKSSKVGMQLRNEAPKSRSASAQKGSYPSIDGRTQSRRNVHESDARAQASSGGEDSSTIVDADVSSVNDSHHEDTQATDLMSDSLKSELAGLVSAVSSIIAPSENPKSVPSRQPSTASSQHVVTQDRSLSEASRMLPKALSQKPARSPERPKHPKQEITPRQSLQQPAAHGYARSASVQSSPKAGGQLQRVTSPGVPGAASADSRFRETRGPMLARHVGSHPSADVNSHRPVGSAAQPAQAASTIASVRSPVMVTREPPASPLQAAGMQSPQAGYKSWL